MRAYIWLYFLLLQEGSVCCIFYFLLNFSFILFHKFEALKFKYLKIVPIYSTSPPSITEVLENVNN